MKDGKEHRACIKEAALGGIEGGRVYDALILAAARKAVVERIYTLNLKHFVALAPPELKGRVVAP